MVEVAPGWERTNPGYLLSRIPSRKVASGNTSVEFAGFCLNWVSQRFSISLDAGSLGDTGHFHFHTAQVDATAVNCSALLRTGRC